MGSTVSLDTILIFTLQLLLYAYGMVPPLQRDLLLPSTWLGEYIYLQASGLT